MAPILRFLKNELGGFCADISESIVNAIRSWCLYKLSASWVVHRVTLIPTALKIIMILIILEGMLALYEKQFIVRILVILFWMRGHNRIIVHESCYC